MAIKLVALEDVSDGWMENFLLNKVVDSAGNFKGGIKLKQWLRSQVAFGQLIFHDSPDLWIGNLEKTTDVVLVIGHDTEVGLETFIASSISVQISGAYDVQQGTP